MGRDIDLSELVRTLEEEYGCPEWWPADSPFEVAVGAILTQRTSWGNVERTIAVLKDNDSLNPRLLADIDIARLEEMVRHSGFYRQKARYLKTFSRYLIETWSGDLTEAKDLEPVELRRKLLALPGIGNETADAILLYALGLPSFVVDEYTYRLLERLGVDQSRNYARVKDMFESSLGLNACKLANAHALIVIHSKERCRSRPRCVGCPFEGQCVLEPEDREE